ncbi:MAG TPA: endonuclease/exonuclease/phosphatase family protein [Thermoanaerobaculia bacterium]|nr:endonuclease/exonuclease/phosphatase family protein [Thermoanaerobaculia bacterium]
MATPIRLRVMSYNVQGHGRLFSRRYLEGIAQVIREAEPDVVGLQEVHRHTWHSRFEDQAAMLGHMTGLQIHFGRSFAMKRGEFGNAVLTRFPVVSTEIHHLPGPGEQRTLLHTRLDLGEAELDFYVTHLAAWGRWNRAARGMQISGLIERLRQRNEPFVLMGDFNTVPGAPEVKALMAEQVFRLCGQDMACTHRVMRQRIDYILGDAGWTTVDSRVLQAGPSDHWPVVVELHRDSL